MRRTGLVMHDCMAQDRAQKNIAHFQGMGHNVVRVPTLPPIFDQRLHLGSTRRLKEQCEWWWATSTIGTQFIDTTNVGDSRWGPPQVDEDWHQEKTRTAKFAYKAVPECLRSRAPPPSEGTLLQQTATWPGPPADPPTGVGEMEVKGQRREAAPAARRRTTRPAQWSAMGTDDARLLSEVLLHVKRQSHHRADGNVLGQGKAERLR